MLPVHVLVHPGLALWVLGVPVGGDVILGGEVAGDGVGVANAEAVIFDGRDLRGIIFESIRLVIFYYLCFFSSGFWAILETRNKCGFELIDDAI